MIITIISAIAGIISFMVLDYVWIGYITKSFYIREMASHLALKDGALAPYLPAVPLVYVIGILGIVLFVLPKVHSISTAFLYGALFGFTLYAFYDITNLATFKDYSWTLALVDIAWGTFVVGGVTTIIFFVEGLMV